jgi:F-type H+-transporting ATPase subunit b
MPTQLVLAAAEGHEPNSFLLPHDINEVIWGSLAFIIVATLIVWKGGPAIKAMWNGRIDTIRNQIETAESARTAAEAQLAEVEGQIADADTERARILAEGRQTAEAVKAQLVAKAATDAEDIRVRGAADIESTKSQASGDLEAEVGLLAIGAAEAVVAHALDAQAQSDLIDRYISSVGGQR